MKRYVLYNPQAGDFSAETLVKTIGEMFPEEETIAQDVTKIEDMKTFIGGLTAEDKVTLCGGDGTVNRFVNGCLGMAILQEISYYPAGSGNDFARELEDNGETAPYIINKYIENLPTVTVNGNTYAFVNGVGYGIDGYCCEVGDKLKANGKKPNYTSIAIKGLLFHYKTRNATVIVDGQEYTFKNVWLAPTMNGKYYGGGMIPTPNQVRLGEDKKLSILVFMGKSKLKTLMIFPSIFKGEHIRKEKATKVLTGKEITVKFDAPTPLQIDGETILGVTEYTARV